MMLFKDICTSFFTQSDYIRLTQSLNKLKTVQAKAKMHGINFEPAFKYDFDTMIDTLSVIELQLREFYNVTV